MNKQTLLDIAVQKINDLPEIQCHIVRCGTPMGVKKADVQVLINKDDYQQNFIVEIKNQILPAQIPQIKEQTQGLTHYILIAEYITTQAKEILRKERITYLDTLGNFYLNDRRIFIFIETNKTNGNKRTEGNNRAFNKAGLKVVYQFLIHPEYLNKPYRFIAEQATVTIDTVGKVIHGLLDEKYIIQAKNKVYQFVERTKLFQEWVTAFNKTLRPKLNQNRYQWLNKNQNWKNTILPKDTYWGGALAAEGLVDYLIADKVILYTKEPYTEVMKHLKIIPHLDGKITVMERFWKANENELLIHPILVYADLINDSNPRYIETANKIYEQYVKDKL